MLIAASFASDTPLLVSGLVRSGGLWGNWLWLGLGISTVLSAFLFAPLWRRAAVVTDAELTELRYSGRSAALLRGAGGLRHVAAAFLEERGSVDPQPREPFARIHDLSVLWSLLPPADGAAVPAQDLPELQPYAAAVRYPGVGSPPDGDDGRRAIDIAGSVLDAARSIVT